MSKVFNTLSRASRTSAFRAIKPSPLRRAFADVPPPSPASSKASNTPLYLGGLGVVALGTAFYFFGTEGSPEEKGKEIGTAIKSVERIGEAKAGLTRSKEEYQKVYNAIAEILEDDEYDDGSFGPVLVRLAWHCSGTYDKETKTGGSDKATMRFKPESVHGANNGLNIARDKMQKIKDKFDWISYGDLWTLGGVCAIQEMQGPRIPWRPGRIDGFDHHATPDGRLPDASQGHDHLRQIFYRMGFNDQEIVALSGAHALGRCHTDRSGFEGPWTFSPTMFTNDYYKLLFDEKWSWRKWNGPKQLQDNKTKTLMMLPTDYTLTTDASFKKTAQLYAKDQDKFFSDFAAVFHKLTELGVPTAQFAAEPWSMLTVDEVSEQKK